MNHLARAVTYIARALALKCPECGTKPIFIPLDGVRRLRDWFTPLDGCPRCGYAYERETGYFLLAIWAVNYGVGSLLGLAISFALEIWFSPPLPVLLAAVIVPVVFFNILFARHSKALFLALDHYFDPHIRDTGGDDGGNVRTTLPPPLTPAPPRVPAGSTSCR